MAYPTAYMMELTRLINKGLVMIDVRDLWKIRYNENTTSRIFCRGYRSFDVEENADYILAAIKDMGVDIRAIEVEGHTYR